MNNLKINNIIILFFVLTINGVFSQNKKEQIKQFQLITDSLISVLNIERNSNKQKLQELYSELDSVKIENKSTISQLTQKSIELEKLNRTLLEKDKKEKNLEQINHSLTLKISELEKEINNRVVCKEQEEPNKDDIDNPILITNCSFRSFSIRKKGESDDKGRYFYTYKYFNNNIEINPSKLFNSKIDELEVLLNKKFKEEFNSLSKNPDSDGCFNDITYENITIDGELSDNYRFNQIDVDFSDYKIMFSRSFGLPGACNSLDGVTIDFTISEIESYFAK